MKRLRVPELMDDPGLEEQVHAHALRSLNRVNRLLGVDAALHRSTSRLAGGPAATVLDLGTGGAGFLEHLASNSSLNGRHQLVGLDRSAFALCWARENVGGGIRLIAADACRIPLADNSVDVVTCSLFLHHFDPENVIRILREAARVSRRGIVVGDLHRSRTAWLLTWAFTRLLSRSRIFHVDGPRSVRAAFTPRELAELASGAGLAGARVRRQFPFRLLLTWQPDGGHNGNG